MTVLSVEKWQAACGDLGVELPWTTRRANLLVSGLSIGPECVGRILQVGDAQLRITIETDPCPRMDEQYPGLKRALVPDWRGGACCEVTHTDFGAPSSRPRLPKCLDKRNRSARGDNDQRKPYQRAKRLGIQHRRQPGRHSTSRTCSNAA